MSFSPIVPHNGEDLAMRDDNTEQNERDAEHNKLPLLSANGPLSAVAESEIVKRAMTPVIGSFSQQDEAGVPRTTSNLSKTSNIAFVNLMGSPSGSVPQTPLARQQSMCSMLPSLSVNQDKRLRHSPLDSQFSRQFSSIDVESVASSAVSSIDTRNQIDKCKDVLLKALNMKKLGCLKDYHELISQQPFTKANCNERVLRLWTKAFLEMMPVIVKEFGDNELVELLLFKLPWLCYGLKQGLKVSANGAISVKRTTGLASTSQQRQYQELGSLLNSSQANNIDCGASGTVQSMQQSEVNSSQGGEAQSSVHPFNLRAQDLSQQTTNPQSSKAANPRVFGPSFVHGQHFHLFQKLCFAVIPLQVQQAHRILKHVFSHLGQFICENPKCMGNPKTKELTALQPPTIASIFKARLVSMIDPNSQLQNSQADAVDLSSFKNILKPHSNSQKSLEALNHEIKRILKDAAQNLPESMDTESAATQSVPISNQEARRLLLALLSYHPDKKVHMTTPLSVTLTKGTATLLVDNDPTSFRKCLVTLQKLYLERLQQYAKDFFQHANIKALCQLVVQIVHQYPFTLKEVQKLLLSTYPHQNASIESLVVFQRVAHEIVDGLLKRVCRNARQTLQERSKANGTSTSPSKTSKLIQPLRQALDLEKAVLTHSIEKIAALDATDLKLKPRKGSTYPVREGQGTMQSTDDYEKELTLRFLTDKELKNSLLLVELFAYIRKRIIHINKYEGEMLGSDQGSNMLTDCLLSVFEERIFSQNKSKLLQYIPLFVMGHANRSMSSSSLKTNLSQESISACNTFGQLIFSFLVRSAFPQETTLAASASMDNSSAMLDRRMKALNYLGSMLSQTVVKLPAPLMQQCLALIMNFQDQRQKRWSQQGETKQQVQDSNGTGTNANGNTSSHKLFNHCLYQNLAMLFAAEHQMLKDHDIDLFSKLCKHLFQRKYGSLEYASPHVLHSLLDSTKTVDEFGDLVETSENKQMYHIKRKVLYIVDQQNQAVNSSKMAVYKMIPRWMPYSIPLYIDPIKAVFEKMSTQLVQQSPEDGPLEAACSKKLEMDENLELLKQPTQVSSNILNEPVSPRDYKLQHRKSIHDYFNPEHGNSNHKASNISSNDDMKLVSMASPHKGQAVATMTGLVSEAFRKQNKFTQAAMIKVNPQLQVLSQSSSTQRQTQSSALSSLVDDEVMSSGPQSDQMTIASPIPQDNNHQASFGSAHQSQKQGRALQKAINSDIEKGLKHLTQSIQEANRVQEEQAKQQSQSAAEAAEATQAAAVSQKKASQVERSAAEIGSIQKKASAPFRPPKSKKKRR